MYMVGVSLHMVYVYVHVHVNVELYIHMYMDTQKVDSPPYTYRSGAPHSHIEMERPHIHIGVEPHLLY